MKAGQDQLLHTLVILKLSNTSIPVGNLLTTLSIQQRKMDNDELLQLDEDDTDDWILPVLLVVYILTQRQPRLRTNRSNTGQGHVLQH
jgi:hypothetical protein